MSAITTDLMETVDSLPIDMKLELVDKILDSLTPRQKDIDELWQIEAERRVEEVRSGKVQTIPGEQVFEEIRQRFGK
jgi:putative addiction module component (TIGR02574 family)